MAKKWELTLGDDINTFIFLDGCEGIDVANDESARIGSVKGGEGKVGEDPGGGWDGNNHEKESLSEVLLSRTFCLKSMLHRDRSEKGPGMGPDSGIPPRSPWGGTGPKPQHSTEGEVSTVEGRQGAMLFYLFVDRYI